MEYPEHDKLQAVKDKSQMCGEFVEWLENVKGIHLAEWAVDDDFLLRTATSVERLLAEFFEIDLDALEAEKRAMLAEQRALNTRGR